MAIAALAVLATDPAGHTLGTIVALLFVLGFGVGPMYPVSTIVMQNVVKPHQLGTATGKSVAASWNGLANGSFNVVADMQNAGYARIGVPRDVAVAHTLAVGIDSLAGGATQSRFQGLSVAMKPPHTP